MSKDAAHGSLRSYGIGFALSVILTVIPFWVVMGDVFENRNWAIFLIFAMGGAQMLVHIHYFLHVSLGAEDGWQMMSTVLTVILLVIVLSGSIWVMYHLNTNMMPAHEQIERLREFGS